MSDGEDRAVGKGQGECIWDGSELLLYVRWQRTPSLIKCHLSKCQRDIWEKKIISGREEIV